jgi:hypothetical protein
LATGRVTKSTADHGLPLKTAKNRPVGDNRLAANVIGGKEKAAGKFI